MVRCVATRKRAGGELLERGDELAALYTVITDLGVGGGGFAVIEGAAGIGKSSLLAEGRARAADAGFTVLHARGTEIERPLAYGVVRQLFEALIRTSGARRRAKLFEGAAAHARQLFEPAQAIKDVPVDDVEFTLLHGLYWLTMNVADGRHRAHRPHHARRDQVGRRADVPGDLDCTRGHRRDHRVRYLAADAACRSTRSSSAPPRRRCDG
jgi:hypothetical protein